MTFEAFPKIPRLNRGMVVTEKIDGTNAQVHIVELVEHGDALSWPAGATAPAEFAVFELNDVWYGIAAGSRKRYITPEQDNFGFARWVWDHAEDLVRLGPGRHYGEWWGQGIQRGYGLDERRFSLFNTGRWLDSEGERVPGLPDCVGVVPVLYRGPYDHGQIDHLIAVLGKYGSTAAPDFPRPEGVVVWHEAARQLFKVLVENDDIPKGVAA